MNSFKSLAVLIFFVTTLLFVMEASGNRARIINDFSNYQLKDSALIYIKLVKQDNAYYLENTHGSTMIHVVYFLIDKSSGDFIKQLKKEITLKPGQKKRVSTSLPVEIFSAQYVGEM